MKFPLAAILLIATLQAFASEERPLSGAEIKQLLTGAEVIGDGNRQIFYESGRTLYNDGQDSRGIGGSRVTVIARNGRRRMAGFATICAAGKRVSGSGSAG